MISVQEAIDLIAAQQVKRVGESIPLEDSLNYYLAKPIIASLDLPPFDNSAMDGYAILGSGPSYEIVGEIQAGDTSHYQLNEGEAYRIFTGAKVPENCHAVIMQEKTQVEGRSVLINDTRVEGKNIRRRGEQIQQGKEVFSKGQKINPSVIGLLSSFGYSEIDIYKKPRLHLITTGDELVKPGETLKEGQQYESNSYTLCSTLEHMGFDSSHTHVKDDLESTQIAIKEALISSDVLLVSGGISVGDYDFVKKALEENGVEEIFYKVFQKPGKPLYFGKTESTFVFGLPGNPASSLVCLMIYVIPLLQRLIGSEKANPDWIHLPLSMDYSMPFDRPSFLKSQISADGVTILEGQGSSMLLSMAKGNALTLLEPKRAYKKGEMVKCLLMN
ncbi:MAG: gephyrin-like molybdotransferase Glp [Bacteroidota bacterium]